MLSRGASLGLLALLLGVPVANVLVRASLQVTRVEGQPAVLYSAGQIVDSIQRSLVDYSDECFWSAVIASVAASLILLTSLGFAWLARESTTCRVLFAIAMALACAIPGPALGLALAGWFAGLSHPWINWLTDYTVFGPVMAATIFCWPVGGMLAWFLIRRIPQAVLDSAQLEGASSWHRGWTFGILGNVRGWMGIWILVWTVCFGELSASQMVRPAGMDTVPRKLLGDLHAGVNELTAGMTLVLMLATMLFSWIGWLLLWLNQRGIRQQWSEGSAISNP